MDERYAGLYEDLYRRHWWWRARERFVLQKLREFVPEGGFGQILDVGCGNGLLFPELQAFGEPYGVETDQSLLTEGNPWLSRITCVPFERFETSAGRFGLIVMLDVLEHMDSPHQALAKAQEMLAPGGLLLVTLPAFNCLWTHHDDLNHHVERFTKTSFETTVPGTGLSIERMAYFFHWLFPLKIAVRAVEKIIPAGPDERMTVVPSNLVNSLMGFGCAFEQVVLSAFPLPFGSSLLAVLARSEEFAGSRVASQEAALKQ